MDEAGYDDAIRAVKERRRARRLARLRKAITRTMGGAAVMVGQLPGKLAGELTAPWHRQKQSHPPSLPGAAPGLTPAQLKASMIAGEAVEVEIIDYSRDRVERTVAQGAQIVTRDRPEWATVRWIDVRGLRDGDTLAALAQQYGIHPLVMEDVVHTGQRPKVESYQRYQHADASAPGDAEAGVSPAGDQLFAVLRMFKLEGGTPTSEQASLLLMGDTLVSLQERSGDVWDGVRYRLETLGSRLRQHDTSFLMYALLDAVVDGFFPVLEHYSDRLDLLEQEIYSGADGGVIEDIHEVRRSLLELRRQVWPMREVMSQLTHDQGPVLDDQTRVYMRDVYDHVVQVLDIVESSREMSSSLAETWMSVVSNRMNEVMKVLTVMGSVFLPISFLAGVYGMNFVVIPGADEQSGFWIFVGACLAIAGGMLAWFRRKHWI